MVLSSNPPHVVNLVHDEELVPDFLCIEKFMKVWHKLQQLLEAVPEGHDDGQPMGPPGRLIPRVKGAQVGGGVLQSRWGGGGRDGGGGGSSISAGNRP
jgi:hypothetical protein